MANNYHKCAYVAPTVVLLILCLSLVEYPTFIHTVHKYSLENRKKNDPIFAQLDSNKIALLQVELESDPQQQHLQQKEKQQQQQKLQQHHQLQQRDQLQQEEKLQHQFEHQFQHKLKQYKEVKKVFYNRVRKCRSVTTLALFKKLSTRNKWHFTKKFWPPMQGYCARRMRYWTHDFPMVKGVVKHVIDAPTPGLAQGHVHYIDFSKFKHTKDAPVYINLIRRPFDRLVSSFYYMRRSSYKQLPKDTRDLNYDDCVSSNVSECVKADPSGYFTLIPWFCGHDSFCLYPNEEALQRAKSNVEKHYAIIGLNEHYPEFLHSLELMFPQYFRGAIKIFTKMREENKSKQQVPQTLAEPSNATKEIMHNLLQEEMDFYQFVKQRFFIQYNFLKSAAKVNKE